MGTDGAPRPFVDPLLGIVFDLDGTLVESRHDFRRMRHEVVRIAEAHGVVPGHLSASQPIVRILEAAHEELERAGVPEGEIFRMDAEANRTIDAIELEALPRTVARAGAAELLTALDERGYRLGLLTRSSETFSRAALERTGLLDRFDHLRTRSAPGPAKPSPEALLSVLAALEVPGSRALFVGDHLLDAECAQRAGIRFVAVGAEPPDPDLTEDRFRTAGAIAVAPDLWALAAMLGIALPRPPAAVG
ncbi:MAG TPA: HAD family hydrolase [Thermoplasmata archaeon]|nr:HAD family hydrolase [Thermoplasmata archaeon]